MARHTLTQHSVERFLRSHRNRILLKLWVCFSKGTLCIGKQSVTQASSYCTLYFASSFSFAFSFAWHFVDGTLPHGRRAGLHAEAA